MQGQEGANAGMADIAVRGWAEVTVRVAWTLMRSGVRVRPHVLRDARDHVWFHVPASASMEVAEDRAERLTRDFIARAKRQYRPERWGADDEVPLSPRWRSVLTDGLSRVASHVWYRHYADGEPLVEVARSTGIELMSLEAAREGLREILRVTASEDGVSMDSWHEQRVDRLLRRHASMASPGAPPLGEVAAGLHDDWARRCVRCRRARALVSGGVLRAEELVPPALGARPTDRVRIVALHFHPDGRHHRAALGREMRCDTVPEGDDVLLVDAADVDRIRDVLMLASEVEVPPRDHIRGAVLEGPGRWSSHGLLGPLMSRYESAVRSMPWGSVDGIGELRDRLPAPPSARGIWAVVAVLVVVLATLTRWTSADEVLATYPLEIQATPGRSGVWIEYDVDDRAYVWIVRMREGVSEVLVAPTAIAEKMSHAVGDGTFRLHTEADAVLVASLSTPLMVTEDALADLHGAPEPLSVLEQVVLESDPLADVWTYQNP